MGVELPIDESMNPVIDQDTKSRVAALRAEIDGQLSDRTRVIDHLLDFRLETTDVDRVSVIDRLLASVPGLTVVDNDWWRDALDQIEQTVEHSAV